jgi:hypothetical protein
MTITSTITGKAQPASFTALDLGVKASYCGRQRFRPIPIETNKSHKATKKRYFDYVLARLEPMQRLRRGPA